MGIKLGALVSGAADGFDKQTERNRQAIRDTRDEERYGQEKIRDVREAERYGQEKTDRERKMAQDKQSDDIAARFADLNKRREMGLLGDKENQVQPTAIDAPTPVGQQPAPTAQPMSGGIAAPMTDAAGKTMPAANPPAAAPQTQNLFTSGGEGKYKNQAKADDLYYKSLGGLLREDYTNKREFGKALLVDQELEALREKGYDKLRKVAAAGAVSGAPAEVLSPLVEKAYATINDGKSVSVVGKSVDPKTNAISYDLKFTDKATGTETLQSMTALNLYGALNQSDALTVAKFNIENAQKDREIGIKDKSADADVTRAGAAVTSANAEIVKAGAAVSTARATADRYKLLGDRENKDASFKEQKARTETLMKLFPIASKEDKQDDLFRMKPDQLKAYETKKAEETTMLLKAQELSGLNPKVDVGTISQIVRSKQPMAKRDTDGSIYTMVGGKKIILQQP